MSLYAIGDLHLHFQTDLKAKAQLKDRTWRNHEQKVQKYCAKLIQPDDTLVLAGDHSWGRNLDECEKDLQFIAELPGRKILIRGNHDMFWDAKKTQMLNDRYAGKLLFLQDNFYPYVGSDWKTVSSHQFKKEFTLRAGYEIAERTTDKHGQLLLIPDVEVETWWTNLGSTDQEIISLYHAHGECEQYHSEVKTDMDLERLPSGKFETNALILELGMIAYNLLRMIGQGTIGGRALRQKRELKRRRLRTVISNMIMMACHITAHARQLILGLGRSNVWRYIFMDYCQAL